MLGVLTALITPSQGDGDFPPAAAQVAHQKPQPCLEKFAPQHRINQHIPQPRK